MTLDGTISSRWRKSSRSIGNGQCIEAASLTDGRLAVRDSTDRSGPIILLSQREWLAFIKEIKGSQPGLLCAFQVVLLQKNLQRLAYVAFPQLSDS